MKKKSNLKDVVEKVDFSEAFGRFDGLDPEKDPEMKKFIEDGTIFKKGCGMYYARKPFEHKRFFMCPFTGMVCLPTETIKLEWPEWVTNEDK